MIARGFIAGLFVLLGALPAVGAPVTFTFAGQLSFVSPALSSLFNIGDSFAGSFTFESVTPDLRPMFPDHGEYRPDISFSISAGALSFSSPSPTGGILILDDSPLGASQDVYSATGNLTSGSMISGFVATGWEFVLIDNDRTMLNSDALPLTPPPLSLAEIADLEIFYRHPDGRIGSTVGILTSFESAAPPVPEPGLWALMLAGLGILGFAARRRRA